MKIIGHNRQKSLLPAQKDFMDGKWGNFAGEYATN